MSVSNTPDAKSATSIFEILFPVPFASIVLFVKISVVALPTKVSVAAGKVTVTSASPTLDQIVCENGAITPITFDISGSATNASGSGLPPGISLGPVVGNTITISGNAGPVIRNKGISKNKKLKNFSDNCIIFY
mgnify:CR=1 FL=1